MADKPKKTAKPRARASKVSEQANEETSIIPHGDKDFPLGPKFKQSEFIQRFEDDGKQVFLLHCPTCGGIHFRHAGYVHTVTPYAEKNGGESKVISMDRPVSICVKCKHSIFMDDGVIYDITAKVDLNAWEKTEKEAHKATGPGGQC